MIRTTAGRGEYVHQKHHARPPTTLRNSQRFHYFEKKYLRIVWRFCGYIEVRYASAIFFCDRTAIAEPVTPQWFSYLSI